MKVYILKFTLLLFLLLGCQGENVRRKYKDLNAAIAAGEQVRGWLPPFLPKSSINIKIYNNVDTNTGGGTFDFSPLEIIVYTEEFKSRFAANISERHNSTLVNFEFQKSQWNLKLPKSGKDATWALNPSL
jgi:hypothetical protein